MNLKAVAHVHTGFTQKFGIPRQSGLVSEIGHIIFEPDFRNPNYLEGILDYDYLWLIWGFSKNKPLEGATVRPPRLGGQKHMGVFATRSPFRPNNIGLSSVRLINVIMDTENGPVLEVEGVDMLDGTPIYDIKPYIPYADAHVDARGGFTDSLPTGAQIEADSLGDIEANTVRAMNGLYSESDRAILQEANKASVETINSTINQANYNGKNLLDGTSGDINIFTGSSSSTITETDAKAAMAGLENFDVSGKPENITTEALDNAYSNLADMRSKLGAEVNGLSANYNENLNTAENVTAAESRKVDAEFNKSVTDMKSAGIVGAAQNMAMKNQMESQEGLVNRLMQ